MQPTLHELQLRTADEISAYRRHEERLPPAQLNFAELINSRMEHPARTLDGKAVQAFAEMSETCRQRSGQVPAGTWVPLNVLTRDLTTGTAASLAAPAIGSQAAASLLPASAVISGGATFVSGITGTTFALPTTDTSIDASSAWIAEGGDAPQTEPSFGQAVLTPHALSVQLVVSRRLLQNSEVDLDSILRRELAQGIALAIDRAAIQGTGSGQPQGILNHSSLEVVSAGTDGAAPTWGHIAELEYRVNSRIGGEASKPVFLTSPYLARKLRTTPRASGGERFILDGADMAGYGVRASTNVPDDLTKGTAAGICSALLFGALSEVVVGWWGPAAMDVIVDSRTLANRAAVRIVARADVGIAVRRIGAFAAYKDFLAA